MKQNNTKGIYFLLGLCYAYFLYFSIYSYTFIGRWIFVLLAVDESLKFSEALAIWLFLMIVAVFGLIVALFPIWLYLLLRSKRNDTRK